VPLAAVALASDSSQSVLVAIQPDDDEWVLRIEHMSKDLFTLLVQTNCQRIRATQDRAPLAYNRLATGRFYLQSYIHRRTYNAAAKGIHH